MGFGYTVNESCPMHGGDDVVRRFEGLQKSELTILIFILYALSG